MMKIIISCSPYHHPNESRMNYFYILQGLSNDRKVPIEYFSIPVENDASAEKMDVFIQRGKHAANTFNLNLRLDQTDTT